MKVDYSRMHALDHWPWERRCWDKKNPPYGWERPFYGGPVYHLRLAWDMRRRDQLKQFFLTPVFKVLCRWGRHDEQVWHSWQNGFRAICMYCFHSRPARKDEEFDFPDLSGEVEFGYFDLKGDGDEHGRQAQDS